MNWKSLLLFIVMFAIGYLFYQTSDWSNSHQKLNKKTSIIYYKKYEKLLQRQRKFTPDSPQGIQITEKIKKLEKLIDGYVKSDEPDEFVRILNEMKIPYGEKYSSYPPNYQKIELDKAKQRSLNKAHVNPLSWIEKGDRVM